ncbi:hypothetical protein MHYP_G00316640 [Metynnis hypsauchen]
MAEHIDEPDRQKSAPGPEQIPSQTTTTTNASGHYQQGLLTVAEVPEVWRAQSVDSMEASLRLSLLLPTCCR